MLQMRKDLEGPYKIYFENDDFRKPQNLTTTLHIVSNSKPNSGDLVQVYIVNTQGLVQWIEKIHSQRSRQVLLTYYSGMSILISLIIPMSTYDVFRKLCTILSGSYLRSITIKLPRCVSTSSKVTVLVTFEPQGYGHYSKNLKVQYCRLTTLQDDVSYLWKSLPKEGSLLHLEENFFFF